MNAVQREQIEQLLRQGWTNRKVGAQVRVRPATVAAIRSELGLPPALQGQRVDTVEEAFTLRTAPAEDGHLVWRGNLSNHDSPVLQFRGRRLSPYRVSFRMTYGREPVGMVRAACEVRYCVAGRCLDDDVTRRRTREQLAALRGLDQSRTHCEEGHVLTETAVYRGDGGRQCGLCTMLRRASRAGKEVAA